MFNDLHLQHTSAMSERNIDSLLWAESLIHSRRTTLPKRLTGPGPDDHQKVVILEAAAAAPDHDQILPWRFIEIPCSARQSLGLAFEKALLERDPEANPEECLSALEKAQRSPWLLLAVARTQGEPIEIGPHERLVSAGAAIQNVLLMATALGMGSALTSGKALQSSAIRDLFKLHPHEQALCFINIGHIVESRKPRSRPNLAQFFSVLT